LKLNAGSAENPLPETGFRLNLNGFKKTKRPESAVHDRVTGNCSTTLLGRTNAAEMAERSYRFLNPDIKAAATRLDKGQLILSHAVFREPVKIRFPMAAYKQPS